MAERNRKDCAEYFSHDADASSDEKVVYLESVFGITGYAMACRRCNRQKKDKSVAEFLQWKEANNVTSK